MFKRLGLWLGVGVLGMLLSGAAFGASIEIIGTNGVTSPGGPVDQAESTNANDVTMTGNSTITADADGSARYTVKTDDTLTTQGNSLTLTGQEPTGAFSDKRATLEVETDGTVTVSEGGSLVLANSNAVLINTGAINNSGTITFAAGSSYAGPNGTIDNSITANSKIVVASNINNGSAADGYAINDLLNDLADGGGGDIGNVSVTGQLVVDLHSPTTPIADGEVTLSSAQGDIASSTAMTHNINVGQADLVIAEGGLFGGTIIAGNVNINKATVFLNTVDASEDLIVEAETEFDKAASGKNAYIRDEALFNDDLTATNAIKVENGGVAEFTKAGAQITAGAGGLSVDATSWIYYDTGSTAGVLNHGLATVNATTSKIDGSLGVAAGDSMRYKGDLAFGNNAVVYLEKGGSDAQGNAAQQKIIVDNDLTGVGGANSVYLHLDDGATKNWAGVQAFDVAGALQNAIFDTRSRLYVNSAGVLSRKATYPTFSPILDNRNAASVGGYYDYVLNHTDYGKKDNLDDFLDGIYADMLAGNGGSASRRLGATQSQHAVYVREGLMLAHDAFWNGLDKRRNLNLDLNYDLAVFSSRRAPAPRPGATRSDDAYSVGSYSAYGDLVPPNCYPARGRTVRDRNGGYSYAGGNSTVWGDYIGAYAKQKSRNGISGYDAHANGLSLGYEYHLGQFTFGAAASYARTNVDVDRYNADIDTDALNLALYADFNHSSGFFARGGLGFSYGWNDYRARGTGYRRTGDVHNLIWNVNLQAGYAIRTRFINIIPSLGVRFSNLRQDSWTERDRSGFGLDSKLGRRHDYSVDLPLEVRLNKTFAVGGVLLSPEVKAGFTYAAKQDRAKLNYSLSGAPGHASIYGVDYGRSRGIVGAGLRAKFGMVDAGLDYNFEFAKRYRQHNLTANVGVSF